MEAINKGRLLPHAYCGHISILEITEQLCSRALSEGIEGDFAEAGVATGVHPIIMSQYDRKVHLFDSFQGVPIHGPEDEEWTAAYGESMAADQRKSSGIASHSFENVKDLLRRFSTLDKYIFHEGWFIDTFPKLTDEKFAVLRLDCDLYESYKLCFEYLLPRLTTGGYLIIDDFLISGFNKLKEKYLHGMKWNTIEGMAWCKR